MMTILKQITKRIAAENSSPEIALGLFWTQLQFLFHFSTGGKFHGAPDLFRA